MLTEILFKNDKIQRIANLLLKPSSIELGPARPRDVHIEIIYFLA